MTEISDLIADVFRNTPATGVSILHGSQNEIFYQEQFGVILKSSNLKITDDTLFDVQSITKIIATISLLEIYITQGRMSLEDPAEKYLPELRGEFRSNIKIRNLVLHSSGISDEDFIGEYNSPEELWNAMFNAPLRFEPGASIEYTDVGYRLLGLCLERIGGEDLDTLCKNYIWIPWGMVNSTYNLSSIPKENIAGHNSAWGVVDDPQDIFLNKPLGCDGVFTNTKDLVIFCRRWLEKLSDIKALNSLMNISSGVFNNEWSFYESLGRGRKVLGWEQHSKYQSYIGNGHTQLTLEKAGGGGAFISIRPEKKDFFIYLTNHGRPNPFTMDKWNDLIISLNVREIAMKVLAP
ncbi:MAG: serine hydrolase domain-containing protein [Pseudobdellovibrionaceae bacterium]